MTEALLFVFNTVLGIFSLLLILRFYFQFVSAPYGHPITSFIFSVTNLPVNSIKKLVPGIFGYEIASIITAWALETLLIVGTRSILGYGFGISAFLVFLAAIAICKTLVYIILIAVFIQAILSWINPYSPMMTFLQAMTAPFLSRLQKKIPLVGGIDLSPLVLIFVCQLVLIWPIGGLEFYLSTLL